MKITYKSFVNLNASDEEKCRNSFEYHMEYF